MSSFTHTFEDVELLLKYGAEQTTFVNIEIELECSLYGTSPSGYSPPEYYDPGNRPEFEVNEFRIITDEISITLKPKQFHALFGEAAKRMEIEACDAAEESGEFG